MNGKKNGKGKGKEFDEKGDLMFEGEYLDIMTIFIILKMEKDMLKSIKKISFII